MNVLYHSSIFTITQFAEIQIKSEKCQLTLFKKCSRRSKYTLGTLDTWNGPLYSYLTSSLQSQRFTLYDGRFTLYDGSFDTPGQLSSLGEPRSLKKGTEALSIPLPQYFSRDFTEHRSNHQEIYCIYIYDLNIIICEEGTIRN